ncbi:type II secretion system F family protein [Xanthomonas campestris pv. campestris]|uniref:type II secretion system F family protein n=1 Tax=Xanthomonas campestris TaxID=339 RepID=UPI001E5E177E|nr:type II secretion system F family protein [Xanthomonas campestris]MCD0253116.1 type II secretion system F family protein [Xanthomonas campestris pv. campestris]
MELLQALNHKLIRLQLTADVRHNIYTLLAFLLDNGNKMDKSLLELYGIFSSDGAKPGSPAAVFLNQAVMRNKEGRPLSEGFQGFVSPEEEAMIAAGEKAGRLREAFGFAIDALEKKKEIMRAVRGGVVGPLALLALFVVMLLMVSYRLMPALAKTVDLTMLTGPLAWLNAIAEIVTHQGIYIAVAALLGVAWTIWSFANLTGNLRYRLDKLPPWSVYRAMHGTTFLLNVGVMLRSGIPLLSTLQLLEANATPYMRERVSSCIRGIRAGLNLGEALHEAELDFPDPLAVRLIRVFASREGFDKALDNFARQWSGTTVNRVKSAMTAIRIMAMVAFASLLILVVMSLGDLYSVMSTAADR